MSLEGVLTYLRDVTLYLIVRTALMSWTAPTPHVWSGSTSVSMMGCASPSPECVMVWWTVRLEMMNLTVRLVVMSSSVRVESVSAPGVSVMEHKIVSTLQMRTPACVNPAESISFNASHPRCALKRADGAMV